MESSPAHQPQSLYKRRQHHHHGHHGHHGRRAHYGVQPHLEPQQEEEPQAEAEAEAEEAEVMKPAAPEIQVWSSTETVSSGEAAAAAHGVTPGVYPEAVKMSDENAEDEEDEEELLTPKVVQGPMFLMPEARDCEVRAPVAKENMEKALEAGSTAYLQVPLSVPRRRHSWICG